MESSEYPWYWMSETDTGKQAEEISSCTDCGAALSHGPRWLLLTEKIIFLKEKFL